MLWNEGERREGGREGKGRKEMCRYKSQIMRSEKEGEEGERGWRERGRGGREERGWRERKRREGREERHKSWRWTTSISG